MYHVAITGIVWVTGFFIGFCSGKMIAKNSAWDDGFQCAKEIYKTRMNEAYGKIPSPAPFQMPEGARRSRCIECGYTFGTHADTCSKRFGIQ